MSAKKLERGHGKNEIGRGGEMARIGGRNGRKKWNFSKVSNEFLFGRFPACSPTPQHRTEQNRVTTVWQGSII